MLADGSNASSNVSRYGNLSDFQRFDVDVRCMIGMGNYKISRMTLQAKVGATATIQEDYGNVTVTIKNDVINGFSIVLDGQYADIIHVVGYR